MKTLLTGMPYRPSTEPQDVQEVWRKHGWKPAGEDAQSGYGHTQKLDDYDLVQSQDWLEMGGFK
jgi:hypothetical protein